MMEIGSNDKKMAARPGAITVEDVQVIVQEIVKTLNSASGSVSRKDLEMSE